MIKLLLILLVSVSSYAQVIDYSQSSPEITWKKISNDFVELIYPEYLQEDSIYIANLIEHYSENVGATYKIEKPEKITIVLRPETAQPNGFVTLGPRRSEWFASSMYSPVLGGLEWYQALAIHEYRHVMQFDYANKGIIKFLGLVAGDQGQNAGMFIGLPGWFFEGDAVWAETKYTDAGRGRSPRFLARLKSLVKGNDIPTYDEFLGGSFNRPLPNHYAYGYILISSATKKYGEDFWQKVVKYVADFPHPYRIYSGIKRFSGISFEDFYNETMKELKEEWSISDRKVDKEYAEIKYPTMIDGTLYSLTYDLDHFWAIYSGDKKVVDIPYSRELTRVSFSKHKAVYNQYLPSARYGYRDSSDLHLVDLESGESEQITHGERYYNPSLHDSGQKIIATLFDKNNKWKVVELSKKGKQLRSIHFGDYIIAEAHYLDDKYIVAIAIDKVGRKAIVRFDFEVLSGEKNDILLPFSRNTIFNLSISKNKEILFEAQKNGVIDIFKLSSEGVLSQCTQASILASTPSQSGNQIYYSDQVENGSVISIVDNSECKVLPKSMLIDSNYLGENSSDKYNSFSRVNFEKQSSMYIKNKAKYVIEDYGHIDSRLFIPHSWSFIGGNGFQLAAQTDNFLRTLSIGVEIGEDGGENQNYSGINLAFKKYYPIFNLSAGARNRRINPIGYSNSLTWEEKTAQLDIIVPYTQSSGLYNFRSQLALNGGYLDASEYEFNDIPITRKSSYFYTSGVSASLILSKSLKARSIQSPWAMGYIVKYDNLENKKVAEYSAYRLFQNIDIKTPGFFLHDGFKLELQEEKQKDNRKAYLISPSSSDPTDNIFSRGYGYESFAQYSKASFNYIFTVAYPDFNLWNIAYTKRIVSNLFFDTTRLNLIEEEKTLNSYGAELEFETNFFRLVQLNWGLRYSNRLRDSQSVGEIYLATDLSY
jgi:hypothetical protein